MSSDAFNVEEDAEYEGLDANYIWKKSESDPDAFVDKNNKLIIAVSRKEGSEANQKITEEERNELAQEAEKAGIRFTAFLNRHLLKKAGLTKKIKLYCERKLPELPQQKSKGFIGSLASTLKNISQGARHVNSQQKGSKGNSHTTRNSQ